MADVIIILLILMIGIFAVKNFLKHVNGQGGCCGGGDVKPKKKRLTGETVQRWTLEIQGMHCDHCSAAVQNALNDLEGVSAKADFKKHKAEVRCTRIVEAKELQRAVENTGYQVIKVYEETVRKRQSK